MSGVDESSKPKIPRIGVLAVKNNLLSREDLQAALNDCQGAKDQPLAMQQYFESSKLISPENITRLVRAAKTLDLRQKEMKFGNIAVDKGFINQSVLQLVLEEQEERIRKKKGICLIGDMLVEAGLISEKQRDYILILQKRNREENRKNEAEAAALEKEVQTGKKEADGVSGNAEEASALKEAEIITGGVKLAVSYDLMAAFLSKTDAFEEHLTVTDLKEALLEKGIILGVVADEMLEGFIRSSGFKTKSFRVAKGSPPVYGKDARVEFFFNVDYLTVGGMTEDGTIDYKERGEVPHVAQGTVLAEKIPMVESRNGRNIYGDDIISDPAKDVVLKLGKGARLSEDGYKVLAAVDGFPKYTLSGHFFVHDVYITEGDVDYETGHIQYDGNVDIKGRVKSGFKVSGNDISAIEVDGGILKAGGDIMVVGGINEARIYARGNIYAKFIHQSDVSCMGNVVVQKEIVDSQVKAAGSCLLENGKLISSELSAKMGVTIRNIGTDMTEPCTIQVGRDGFTAKELESIKKKIDDLKGEIQAIEEKKESLKKEHLTVQKQITELAQTQDRAQLDEQKVQAEIAELEKGGAGGPEAGALKKKSQELFEAADKAEQGLDECFDKSEEIEDLVDQENARIQQIEKKIADARQERDTLIQWAKDHPGLPIIVAQGGVTAGTLLKGLHSEVRLSEMVRHAKIREVMTTSTDEDNKTTRIYEIQIGQI